MEPITVGIIAAALVQKALNRSEDRAIDVGTTALGRLTRWLRIHLQPDGQRTIAQLSDAPDSPSRARALALAIDTADRQAGFQIEDRHSVARVDRAG